MCGRYVLKLASIGEKLGQELMELRKNEALDEVEISPDDVAPVIIVVNHRLKMSTMRWGFCARQGGLVINARSENARERAMFRDLTARKRCAVPASGYFEWRDGDNQKYLVAPSQAAGMYLAGLYRMEENGEWRFVVLTRAAFGAHSRIHSRMPLTLSDAASVREWLEGSLSLDSLAARNPNGLDICAVGNEQLQMPL